MNEAPRTYYISTRTSAGWHRLHPENYQSLEAATHGLEQHLDNSFLAHGVTLPSGIFRIVRCKPKKESVQ